MILAGPFMPFLRPLGPPRASTVQRAFRTFTSGAVRRQGRASHVPSPRVYAEPVPAQTQVQDLPSSPLPPPPSPPSSTSPAAPPTEPYVVHRTHSKNLPVFHLAKRGGNLRQTKIRKVEGDISALKLQLQHDLGLEPKDVAINQLTRHVIIKGWRRDAVKEFLEKRRF
ncbi:MAG: hypothetical protein M1832_003156 [Thelocarpon impressellum]|nr:MAG: hypothetical protein M1832_003156 [Thelocarpon impressellum]